MQLLQRSAALYTQFPYGDFDYNRAAIYEDSLLYKHARKLTPAATVYDVGCGQGFVLEFLRSRVPCQARGIDFSPTALAACRVKGLNVMEGNNLDLPLPDGVSDYTISNGVVHHTPDPRKSFRELVRITRPGGAVYLSVYNRNFFYYPLYLLTKPLRWLYGRAPSLVMRLLFPFFYFLFLIPVFWVVRGETIGQATGRTWFADLFLTPQATFHTPSEIEGWIREAKGFLLEFRVEKRGAMLSFLFQKPR